eukprot:CAMPEP_0182864322 /NCGR_PEP_ID=MMETSP0034_2-20130328/7109_1 /TAXON_ID=156128 /ORGANISM="Nephroselmis pyriformis, Strain CCMP717" /LENGTH=225 /DNA_ID=CAMNT_0024996577 /DNA_START=45 /DNA_END=718 /DNA_ORIENTATION=-
MAMATLLARLCLTFAALCFAAATPPPSAPSFCHGLDCPAFEDASDPGSAYQTRRYGSSMWTVTPVSGMDYDKAVKEGFDRLFEYISGANDGGVKIPMAAPVAVTVIPGPGPACESEFNVAFFLPFASQADPPAPTSALLRHVTVAPFTGYVLPYGGFSNEATMLGHAQELAGQLDAGGVSYDKNSFVFMGYDSPFRVVGRHNEIMYSDVSLRAALDLGAVDLDLG